MKILNNFITLYVSILACNCSGKKSDFPEQIGGNHFMEQSYTFLDTNSIGLFHLTPFLEQKSDLDVINDEILTSNIRDAYKSAEDLLKLALVSESVFKEYVLPYRVNSAPIKAWRQLAWTIYGKKKIDNVKNLKDLIDRCNEINDALKKDFKFSTVNNLEDSLSFQSIVRDKTGSCITMSNYATYMLRGLGVPVAIDFTPAWGNLAGGHVWNALITSDSTSVPFLGAESNIGFYEPFYLFKMDSEELSAFRLPGKVYRNTFSVDKNSVYFRHAHKDYFLPSTVSSRMVDVTDQYFKVSDISISKENLKANPRILYLSNYNNGKLVPVMATESSKDNYSFGKLVRNMLYFVSSHNEDKKNTVLFPIYLSDDGKLTTLIANAKKKMSFELDKTSSVESQMFKILKEKWNYEECLKIANGKITSAPIKDKIYNLFYWDKRWVFASSTQASSDHVLKFSNIPTETIYLVCEGQPTEEHRPFMFYKGKLKWL